MQKQKIQIIFPANLNYSSLIRHIADEIFNEAGFDSGWRNRLKLVVDELFMNSVRYGSRENESSVYITFEYDDNNLQFVIEDCGVNEKAVTAEELKGIIMKNENNNDLARTSGRGLAMITRQWTDSMQIEKSQYGGIKIIFTKKIETTAPPAQIHISAPLTAAAPAEGVTGGQVYEIKLSGEIDQSNINEKTAPVYEKIKTMPDNSELILDFSEVGYINSTFIGNLAKWHSLLDQNGSRIVLKNVSKQIREVLNLVGLLSLIKIKE